MLYFPRFVPTHAISGAKEDLEFVVCGIVGGIFSKHYDWGGL